MNTDSRVVRNVLYNRAETHPDDRFVKCSGDWITFGQMHHRARRLAGGFAYLGLQKGDRVGVISDTRDEVFVTMLANAVAGTINVGINTFLKGEFLRHQLVDSGAAVLVLDQAGWRAVRPIIADTAVRHVIHLDAVEEPVPGVACHAFGDIANAGLAPRDIQLAPSDLLGLMYTSGTTGEAKGCMLSHGYYTNVPRSYLAGDRLRVGDRVFTAFPFFHTAGQAILFMSGLCNPTELVYEPHFHASTFIKRAKEEDATVLFGVGAMAIAMLAQPESAHDRSHCFRLAQFQPLPAVRQEEFEQRFGTKVITEGYGQTECVPITASKLSDPRNRSSIGRPVDHLDVRLVDENDEPVGVGETGEIVARPRAPEVMFKGYWNNPEATLASFRNLWHHTGDFARQDADGYLYFVDRKVDAIRRRGENISSFAVEAVIRSHPAVAEVAVIGVPSDMLEDEIKAFVVLHKGAHLSPDALFEFCRDKMPYFALPRYVEIRTEIPVNALGKVMKHVLRRQVIGGETIDLHAAGLTLQPHERR